MVWMEAKRRAAATVIAAYKMLVPTQYCPIPALSQHDFHRDMNPAPSFQATHESVDPSMCDGTEGCGGIFPHKNTPGLCARCLLVKQHEENGQHDQAKTILVSSHPYNAIPPD